MNACLMLHGVGPVPAHVSAVERPYWISNGQLDFIIGLARSQKLALTFDDGNETDVTVVLPKLQAAGIKAAFFIVTERIGQPHYLQAEHIRLLHAAGMASGSHSTCHQRWTEMSDEEIARDVNASCETLAELIDAPVTDVAIPYGACNRRVLAVLRNLGVTRVYSSLPGPNSAQSWIVRRDCVDVTTTEAELRTIAAAKPSILTRTVTALRIWHWAGPLAFASV